MSLIKDSSGDGKDFFDVKIAQFAALVAEQREQGRIGFDYFAVVGKDEKTARRIV